MTMNEAPIVAKAWITWRGPIWSPSGRSALNNFAH